MGSVAQLHRPASVQTVTIPVSSSTSSVITLDGFAIGMVILPSTYDGTALTFQVCDEFSGTYVDYEDAAGNAVSLVVEASKAYALPEGLFGARFCKLVAGSSQTDTDTVIKVMLKA